jgi:hypothetical protein
MGFIIHVIHIHVPNISINATRTHICHDWHARGRYY